MVVRAENSTFEFAPVKAAVIGNIARGRESTGFHSAYHFVENRRPLAAVVFFECRIAGQRDGNL